MRLLRSLILLFSTLLALSLPAVAQNATPKAETPPQATGKQKEPQPEASPDADPNAQDPEVPDRIATLERLAQSLEQREAELSKARAAAGNAADPSSRAAAAEKVKELTSTIEKLRADFALYATGIDAKEFEQVAEGKLDIVEELSMVVRPVIRGLKEATEQPRVIEAQKQVIEQSSRRRRIAARAKQNLSRIQVGADNSDLKKRIEALRKDWETRLTEAQNREIIAKDQLRTIEANQTSLLESTRAGISKFFRTRGLHILMALLAFFSVFLGMRLLSRPIRRAAHRKRGDEPTSITNRIISVLFHSMVGLLAVAAAMLVFYAQGDWGLLGISLLFLLGLAWASKEALPRYVDQVQLLLNIGAVREGERIVRNGIPWQVERINMFTYLTNPAFPDCRVRVTINDLVNLRSRPVGANESWFPSEIGDWMMLSDGSRGRVIEQSPEFVRLRRVGGIVCSIPTADYLSKNPERMTPQFGLSETFGIGYRHQATAINTIPKLMDQAVRRALVNALGEKAILDLTVSFKSAGASSLDYIVIGEFRGEVAERFAGIKRIIQSALVDAANTHGWEIPFQQITVHQAAS